MRCLAICLSLFVVHGGPPESFLTAQSLTFHFVPPGKYFVRFCFVSFPGETVNADNFRFERELGGHRKGFQSRWVWVYVCVFVCACRRLCVYVYACINAGLGASAVRFTRKTKVTFMFFLVGSFRLKRNISLVQYRHGLECPQLVSSVLVPDTLFQ